MRILLIAFFVLTSAPALASADTPASPVLKSARFEQVAITVSDLDVALVFYQERLGLSLMFESNGMLFFDVGGIRLLVAKDEARQAPERPVGILYFHVDDFAAALGRLQNSGAKLVGAVEIVQSNETGSLQLQQFEDPDGNMLAIMGFVPR